MNTITVKGYVYAERDEHGIWGPRGGFTFRVLPYDNSETAGAKLGACEFRHTLPDGLNLEAAVLASQIAALEAEKAEAGKRFAETVARIDAQLANLQAITNEVQA